MTETNPAPPAPEPRKHLGMRGWLAGLFFVFAVGLLGSQLWASLPWQETSPNDAHDDPDLDTRVQAGFRDMGDPAGAIDGIAAEISVSTETAEFASGDEAYSGRMYADDPALASQTLDYIDGEPVNDPPGTILNLPAPSRTQSPQRITAQQEFTREQQRFEQQIQSLKKRITQLESKLKRRASRHEQIIQQKMKMRVDPALIKPRDAVPEQPFFGDAPAQQGRFREPSPPAGTAPLTEFGSDLKKHRQSNPVAPPLRGGQPPLPLGYPKQSQPPTGFDQPVQRPDPGPDFQRPNQGRGNRTPAPSGSRFGQPQSDNFFPPNRQPELGNATLPDNGSMDLPSTDFDDGFGTDSGSPPVEYGFREVTLGEQLRRRYEGTELRITAIKGKLSQTIDDAERLATLEEELTVLRSQLRSQLRLLERRIKEQQMRIGRLAAALQNLKEAGVINRATFSGVEVQSTQSEARLKELRKQRDLIARLIDARVRTLPNGNTKVELNNGWEEVPIPPRTQSEPKPQPKIPSTDFEPVGLDSQNVSFFGDVPAEAMHYQYEARASLLDCLEGSGALTKNTAYEISVVRGRKIVCNFEAAKSSLLSRLGNAPWTQPVEPNDLFVITKKDRGDSKIEVRVCMPHGTLVAPLDAGLTLERAKKELFPKLPIPEKVLRTAGGQGFISATKDTVLVHGDILFPGEPKLSGLRIKKSAAARATVGQPLIFTILIENLGTAVAKGIVVEDQLPTGAKLSGTIPKAELAERKLIWRFESLEPGEQQQMKIRVVPDQVGKIGSVATVTCNTPDSTSDDSPTIQRTSPDEGTSYVDTEPPAPAEKKAKPESRSN